MGPHGQFVHGRSPSPKGGLIQVFFLNQAPRVPSLKPTANGHPLKIEKIPKGNSIQLPSNFQLHPFSGYFLLLSFRECNGCPELIASRCQPSQLRVGKLRQGYILWKWYEPHMKPEEKSMKYIFVGTNMETI